jgi:DnaJ family protein B protein 12
VRVHQMGGGAPRRRPHNHATNQPPASPLAALQSLLPLLLLFIIPLLSSLFSGAATTYPSVRFDNPLPPKTQHHTSYNLKVDYYVNPKDVADYSKGDWKSLDKHVEVTYKENLISQCNYEIEQKQRARNDARGFFSRDEVKWQYAQQLPMPACKKLESWGYRIQY